MNKKLLTVAIAGAMAAPMAAQAVKYKLSGQVNRAVVFLDDGVQSDVRSVDANSSGTRFRFKGSEDLGNGMKVGMYYELQTTSASSGTRPDADTGRNTDGIGIRQANVWFSGNWGKLTVGQQDAAGNGATEADLSGTGIANAPAGNSFIGGMSWRSSATGADVARVSSTYNNLDAFSRYDAVRYDSPDLGPVTVVASFGNDQVWEVDARVKSAMGGGKLSGAAFYAQDTGDVRGRGGDSGVDNRWGASLAYLFSQGTNISAGYAENESETSVDSSSWHAKLGHKWGPHAVSIIYYDGDEIGGVDFDDHRWALGYVHNLKKANMQLYAAYYHAELDTPAAIGSVEDVNAVVIGARVKFN